MKKFEGNINGKIYTDRKDFNKAIEALEETDNIYVSYRYVSVPDETQEPKLLENTNKVAIECNKNYVSESQYVKTIINKEDVEIGEEMANKLKCAVNKSDIKRNVCKKVVAFNNRIDENLIHINELKSDYNTLENKMKSIGDQIKTLEDANNNYYLNKEYYINIKRLLDTPVNIPETKDEHECECGGKCGDDCKCNEKKKSISLKDVYDMSPSDLAKYPNKRKITTLADLVEYFLKN